MIDTFERLKRELELVDALGDMEIATELLSSAVPKDAQGNPLNPLDANFRSLALGRMDPIARASREFRALETYTRDTHGATHRHYGVQVLNAFRVEREGETRAWVDAGYGGLEGGERLLLWHGSRTTNFAGILKQGLRIAPPEGEWPARAALGCVVGVADAIACSSCDWVYVWEGRVLRRREYRYL